MAYHRLGGGGINSEGNAIYYNLLVTSASLAKSMNDTALVNTYNQSAQRVKTAFETYFWDGGQYKDNSTTSLHPQDANALALWVGLTGDGGQRAGSISEGLRGNWGEFGALAPELPDTISPFIGSFEVFGVGYFALKSDMMYLCDGTAAFSNGL